MRVISAIIVAVFTSTAECGYYPAPSHVLDLPKIQPVSSGYNQHSAHYAQPHVSAAGVALTIPGRTAPYTLVQGNRQYVNQYRAQQNYYAHKNRLHLHSYAPHSQYNQYQVQSQQIVDPADIYSEQDSAPLPPATGVQPPNLRPALPQAVPTAQTPIASKPVETEHNGYVSPQTYPYSVVPEVSHLTVVPSHSEPVNTAYLQSQQTPTAVPVYYGFHPIVQPQPVAPPQFVSSPQPVAPSQFVSSPQSVTAPQFVSPPESVTAPQFVSPPESVAPPQYVSPPESVASPQYVSQPEPDVQPQYVAPPEPVAPPQLVASTQPLASPQVFHSQTIITGQSHPELAAHTETTPPVQLVSYAISDANNQFLQEYKNPNSQHLEEVNISGDNTHVAQVTNFAENQNNHDATYSQQFSNNAYIDQNNQQNGDFINSYNSVQIPTSSAYDSGFLNSNLLVAPEPIVTKHIYVHVPPPDTETPVALPTPPAAQKKTYNIIFLKVPSQDSYNREAILKQLEAQAVQEKTLIYVLVKKPDVEAVALNQAQQQHSKPEVYFVKYKGNHVAEQEEPQTLQDSSLELSPVLANSEA